MENSTAFRFLLNITFYYQLCKMVLSIFDVNARLVIDKFQERFYITIFIVN